MKTAPREKPTRHFPVRWQALCGYKSEVANEFTVSGKLTCTACLAIVAARHVSVKVPA